MQFSDHSEGANHQCPKGAVQSGTARKGRLKHLLEKKYQLTSFWGHISLMIKEMIPRLSQESIRQYGIETYDISNIFDRILPIVTKLKCTIFESVLYMLSIILCYPKIMN